jgi:hypothetical protein
MTAVSTRSSTEGVVEPEVIPSIFDVKYTPTILTRYPQNDYSPEEPFPAYAAMVRQKR